MVPFSKTPYNFYDLAASIVHGDPGVIGKFEKAFAKKFRYPHALFFPYGRSALWAFLKVTSRTSGNVLIPAYSCPAVYGAVKAANMNIRLMDCEPNHFNVSEASLSKSLDQTISVVVPTPLFGYPVNSKSYSQIIKEKSPDCMVIYDVAQGFSMLDSSSNTLLTRANAVFVGLGEGKVFSTVCGGMLMLSDEELAKRIKDFRDASFSRASLSRAIKNIIWGYMVAMIWKWPLHLSVDILEKILSIMHRNEKKNKTKWPKDANSFPPSFQAALGLKKLETYNDLLAKRRKIAAIYEKILGQSEVLLFPSNHQTTYSHFPILVKDKNAIIKLLWEKGIQVRTPFKYSIPDLIGIQGFPFARKMANNIITLPIWPGMTMEIAKFVAFETRKCYEKAFEIF